MKRGEIWWSELPTPIGRRPVVLLSRDEAYEVRTLVTVAPLTATVRRIPVEVVLGPEDGVPKICVANLDTLMTIEKARLSGFICLLKPKKLDEVNAALKFALAL
jgi:mRNA interferase MazF